MGGSCFVVQEHHATRPHFDFRLEIDGVLKSWAVPKGPSLDSSVKRLAIQVADHPLVFAEYEGIIPEGQRGAGPVVIWDSGEVLLPQNSKQELELGHLSFSLQGKILQGRFDLVRMKKGPKGWLLIKHDDEYARAGWMLESALTSERRNDLKVIPPPCG